MILVDSSIWIDHLHRSQHQLVALLGDDRAGCHPLIIEELALGSIKQRDVMLDLLANLYRFPAVSHDEVLHLTNARRLWGHGVSPIDVHLMAAVAVVGGAQLWTRDQRLKSVCAEVGVAVFNE